MDGGEREKEEGGGGAKNSHSLHFASIHQIPTMKSHPTISLISSSLPSLDPNGQPYSLVLRGEAAELGELELALSSNHPHTRKQLLDEFQTAEADDAFADAEEEDHITQESITINDDPNDLARGGDGHLQSQEGKKRLRDDESDDADDGIEEDFEYGSSEEEQLLCYIPSIQCTCSSWNMDNISGELFVTSIRVLFLADKCKKQQEDTDDDNLCNDVAIDGRYIALHAMDSDPSSENSDEIVSHIYCQLSDPSAEDGDANGIGCQSALSMVAPTNNIAEENEHTSEIMDEEDCASGGDGSTVEVYFRPLKCENAHSSEESCQTLFNALSQLASNLNAANDTNDNTGGLFSMLSMMAGMSGNEMIVADDESEDDDMIIRYGGGNNFVENDDDSSQGAADGERAAMLQRLDDMLVVPPELRISSDDEEGGQFDDADEDDDVL